MAAVALPSEAELAQLSKNDLIGVVQNAVKKLQTQGGRIRKMGQKIKDVTAEYAKSGALELADYASAAAGAAGVGAWMGSIQAKIDAGEEGYDEEALLIGGVDKDLAAAIVGAGAAYLAHRRAEAAKEAKDEVKSNRWRQTAHYVKQGAAGILAGWAYRMSYEWAVTPPEEEGEEETA